jgi:hypothetical protein
MEVHAHTHTPRKKWTHYFWEFLMLFFAVFCGFLAENQREHYIEHQREKQFMASMIDDLRSDTALLSHCVAEWSHINNSIDSVSDAIQFPLIKTDFAKAYRHLSAALNYYGFRYNDRTIAQLKNSGGFRLIRQNDVANKIILYDQFNQDAMAKIEGQHNTLYMQTLALRNKVFVQAITNEVYRNYKYLPPPAGVNSWIDSMMQLYSIPFSREEYDKLMFEFKNSLQALRKDFTNLNWGYVNEKDHINGLMILIQRKYHLPERTALEK